MKFILKNKKKIDYGMGNTKYRKPNLSYFEYVEKIFLSARRNSLDMQALSSSNLEREYKPKERALGFRFIKPFREILIKLLTNS